MEQAVGEGVNALSLEGRGVSAEKGLCSPPSLTHNHTHTHCYYYTHCYDYTHRAGNLSQFYTSLTDEWSRSSTDVIYLLIGRCLFVC